MLTFEIDDVAKTVHVDCDAKGMGTLLRTLAYLVEDRASHQHLRVPNELDHDNGRAGNFASAVIIDYYEGD